jgi:hypothetical protein
LLRPLSRIYGLALSATKEPAALSLPAHLDLSSMQTRDRPRWRRRNTRAADAKC